MVSSQARRRTALAVGAALALAVATVTPRARAGAEPDGGPRRGPSVDWQSSGDSFSSGEGVDYNEGPCAQAQNAYGRQAAQTMNSKGWTLRTNTFTACTGHLVEDMFNPRSDSEGKASLWQWGKDQGGPDRVDVLTMSFGGNDIGFADIITNCLVATASSFTGAIGAVAGNTLGDCAQPQDVLEQRIDALLDPPKRGECGGIRRTHTDGSYDCDLAIDIAANRRGSIIDFYYDVVTKHLTERGRLYIVGYPSLFAPTNQWPGWFKVNCMGVTTGDASKLIRLAEYFNNKLQEAVRRANQALGTERVVFVDRYAIYRDGLHELCGTNDDWLNGIKLNRGNPGEFHKEGSFHPNAAGHDATAQLLVQRIQETFRWQIELDENGVGLARFGTPVAPVISLVTGVLGPSTSDSGTVPMYRDSAGNYTDDPTGSIGAAYWDVASYRKVCWEPLCLFFGPGGGAEVFRGWQLGTDDVANPPDDRHGLRTTSGIGLGSTVEELRAAYPSLSFAAGEGGMVLYDLGWSDRRTGRVTGLAQQTGPVQVSPGARVVSMSAGHIVESGCC